MARKNNREWHEKAAAKIAHVVDEVRDLHEEMVSVGGFDPMDVDAVAMAHNMITYVNASCEHAALHEIGAPLPYEAIDSLKYDDFGSLVTGMFFLGMANSGSDHIQDLIPTLRGSSCQKDHQ
jgi:hypothetical protein